jgi:hypothetical protein
MVGPVSAVPVHVTVDVGGTEGTLTLVVEDSWGAIAVGRAVSTFILEHAGADTSRIVDATIIAPTPEAAALLRPPTDPTIGAPDEDQP